MERLTKILLYAHSSNNNMYSYLIEDLMLLSTTSGLNRIIFQVDTSITEPAIGNEATSSPSVIKVGFSCFFLTFSMLY